jgi:alpha-L-rhamnosidase
LLTRREYPSWLYPVTRGATTIWERWDGIKPDSAFQDPGMNSFNHYAYGAIGKWMYEVIAGIGIDPAQPGYKNIIIHPRPGGGLLYAEAFHESPYGMIRSGWKTDVNSVVMDFTIPPNTTASVYIPSGAGNAAINGIPLTDYKEMKTSVAGNTIVQVGSGDYQIKYQHSDK